MIRRRLLISNFIIFIKEVLQYLIIILKLDSYIFSIKGLDIETEDFSMTYLFNKFSNTVTEAWLYIAKRCFI